MTVVPRARMRRLAATLAGLWLVGSGCGHHPPQPPPPPPAPVAPRPVIGYEGLRDSLETADLSGLAGRRIVLDPGHGGFFRGALGVHGLTEAEVNLAVASRLRDRLVAHGAQVLLTHETDRDYLSPADSTLRTDLAERVRLANAFAPDFFLSIHHNADATGSHDVNEDPDLLQAGRRWPVVGRGAGHPPLAGAQRRHPPAQGGARKLLRPARERCARGADRDQLHHRSRCRGAPAAARKQAIEADALFLGLARYFARRLPVIAEFRAHDDRAPGEDTLFVTGNPGLTRARAGRLRSGGAHHRWRGRARSSVSATASRWQPDGAWTAGEHETSSRCASPAQVRRASSRLRFAIRPRPARLRVASWPERGRRRRPVRGAGSSCWPATACSRSIPAWCASAASRARRSRPPRPRWWRATAWRGATSARGRSARARVHAGDISHGRPRRPPRSPRPTGAGRGAAPAGARARRHARLVGLRAHHAGGRAARRSTRHRRARPASPRWLDRDGFAVLARAMPAAVLEVPRLSGYRRWAEQPRAAGSASPRSRAARCTAAASPSIRKGGGEDPAGVGASGTRAAHLNLEVARILAQFLGAAGAQVRLTRSGDLAHDRGASAFRRAKRSGADRYLGIGHRLRRFGYYYSSVGGRRWAVGATNIFASLGIPAPPMVEDALYPLQQSSCPALYASPARVDSARDEEALLAAGALRAEAYALFLALAREWAPAASWAVDSAGGAGRGGRPGAGRVRHPRRRAGARNRRTGRRSLRAHRARADRGHVWTNRACGRARFC